MFRRLLDWWNGYATGGSREPTNSEIAAQHDATHTVVLRLDPAALEDPDLEIRWELEKLLRPEYPDL